MNRAIFLLWVLSALAVSGCGSSLPGSSEADGQAVSSVPIRGEGNTTTSEEAPAPASGNDDGSSTEPAPAVPVEGEPEPAPAPVEVEPEPAPAPVEAEPEPAPAPDQPEPPADEPVEAPVEEQPPATEPGECVITMPGGEKVPCYSTHSLTRKDYNIVRAVIMIHGTNRNAADYFGTATRAAELAGKEYETIVIAPHFQSTDDPAEADELQWSSWGWKIGNKSVDKAGLTRISSFAVMDQLIEILTDRNVFPSLTKIVVTGHSAGGQFTQRYAAGTEVDIGKQGYSFRYVSANPGSYVYLNEYRPYPADEGNFTVPQTSCLYDDYKYGLEDRNAYMNRVSRAEVAANYSARRVIYLLGTDDTDVDRYLDTGCEASLQGNNRYERGDNYKDYMDFFYSINDHLQVDVPGIGHTRTGMYHSSVGLQVVFQ